MTTITLPPARPITSRLRSVMRLYFVVVPALILVAGGTSWLAA